MQFTQEIVVNVPRERFVELFDDPDNLAAWQEGFLSLEPISGTPGEAGAKSRLTFRRGKSGTMEMIETITRRELPHAFDAVYDAKGVHNVSRNEFHEAGPGATRWVQFNLFEFAGMMKVVGLLFGRSFPKQSFAYMEAFRSYAEGTAA